MRISIIASILIIILGILIPLSPIVVELGGIPILGYIEYIRRKGAPFIVQAMILAITIIIIVFGILIIFFSRKIEALEQKIPAEAFPKMEEAKVEERKRIVEGEKEEENVEEFIDSLLEEE